MTNPADSPSASMGELLAAHARLLDEVRADHEREVAAILASEMPDREKSAAVWRARAWYRAFMGGGRATS